MIRKLFAAAALSGGLAVPATPAFRRRAGQDRPTFGFSTLGPPLPKPRRPRPRRG